MNFPNNTDPKYALSTEDCGELTKRFTYHSPRDDQPERYAMIREWGRQMAILVMQCCPPSRERSLALTKLEEVVMWANAAIARHEPQEAAKAED